jgi:hypothetical protein
MKLWDLLADRCETGELSNEQFAVVLAKAAADFLEDAERHPWDRRRRRAPTRKRSRDGERQSASPRRS